MQYDPLQSVNEKRNLAKSNIEKMYAKPAVTVIQKSDDDDNLEKGGEGTKGGKVIGNTKSGKSIYDKFGHESHKDFTADDHMDAFHAHNGLRNKERDSIAAKHGEDKKASKKEVNDSLNVQYHGDQMQKHLHSYGKSVLQKSEMDMINNMIEKGEISDCIASGYGAGSEPITFAKTGKEIKERIPDIKSSLTAQLGSIEAQLAALKIKIGKDPERENSRRYDKNTFFKRYDYSLTETPYANGQYQERTEENELCSQYNSLLYLWNEIMDDREAIKIMETNLEDGKKYTLSVSQLIALNFN